MRLHRFIGDYDLTPGEHEIGSSSLANQISNVLRLEIGEKLVLCDGRGSEAEAVLLSVNKSSLHVTVEESNVCDTEPTVPVTLYCAILKRENFEWVAEKAVECGAAEIIPVVSVRTVKTGLRLDRLERIIREATEQSGRGVLPNLGSTMEFSEAIADAGRHGLSVIFQPGHPLFARHHVRDSGAKSVAVFIGPEGGWAEEEVEAAEREGLRVFGLGRRVLRGETAAAVATFLAATAND